MHTRNIQPGQTVENGLLVDVKCVERNMLDKKKKKEKKKKIAA